MNELRRVSLSLSVATGPAGTFYVALIGLHDAHGLWHSRQLEHVVDGDIYAAAEAGFHAALAKMAEPSRIVGAVSSLDVAERLRDLIYRKHVGEPHQVSIDVVSEIGPYAESVVECDARARELAEGGA